MDKKECISQIISILDCHVKTLIDSQTQKKQYISSEKDKNEYTERVRSRLEFLAGKKHSFINYSGTLKIPAQKVNLALRIKEDRKLDVLSFYILDSVKRFKANILVISKTTNFSESLITSEIQRLKNQDLLRDQYGKIELTETGHTLWYANYLSIFSKSKEKKTQQSLILNLIDKSFISDTDVALADDETSIKLFAKYSLDNFTIEDDVIYKYLLDNLEGTNDEISNVIDFLYVDLESEGDTVFFDKHISKLPCYYNGKGENCNSDSLLAKGILYSITFSYESKNYTAYFDTVSGNIFFEPPHAEKKHENLILPKIKNVDTEIEGIKLEAKKYFGLSSELPLKVQDIKDLTYYVGFHLNELTGDL